MSNPYKCIFFDLDHTLWDFETNSCETLTELFQSYGLADAGIPDCQSLHQQFRKVNTELWDLYDRGIITSEVIRRERFKRILQYFQIDDDKLCKDLSTDYLHACPKKGNLVPHALETLEYLAGKYQMTVVTNGFDDIQQLKLASGKLTHFFNHVVTSQKAGAKKPSQQIFEYAMAANGVGCEEGIMIGDNLMTDMQGAINSSIDTVFYNPEDIDHNVNIKYEIRTLAELREFL